MLRLKALYKQTKYRRRLGGEGIRLPCSMSFPSQHRYVTAGTIAGATGHGLDVGYGNRTRVTNS